MPDALPQTYMLFHSHTKPPVHNKVFIFYKEIYLEDNSPVAATAGISL